MPKKSPKIYTRMQGGQTRYWIDLRSYGGRREPLVPRGETLATTDPVIAQTLAADRLRALQEQQRNKHLLGLEANAPLQSYASHHLVLKAQSQKVGEQWLASLEKHFDRAVEFFGPDRELSTIGVRDIQTYVGWLQEQPNGRGGTLGGASVRDHLTALSNLYRRAAGESRVPPGFNPVASLIDKPTAKRAESKWLEVHDAALLLEAARLHRPDNDQHFAPYIYPLIATYLLTGARETEVLGLEVDDVSFDRKTIVFRPNDWRRLKTRSSSRVVPLWPQLEQVLREYVFGGDRPVGRLLFPSTRSKDESMISDWRKSLDTVAERAGWTRGEVRSRMFRHTYCAARLQTLDRGYPVSVYTVSQELGHGGEGITRKVYAHLGTIRHRSEVVEYVPENHVEVDGYRDRLKAVRVGEGSAAE